MTAATSPRRFFIVTHGQRPDYKFTLDIPSSSPWARASLTPPTVPNRQVQCFSRVPPNSSRHLRLIPQPAPLPSLSNGPLRRSARWSPDLPRFDHTQGLHARPQSCTRPRWRAPGLPLTRQQSPTSLRALSAANARLGSVQTTAPPLRKAVRSRLSPTATTASKAGRVSLMHSSALLDVDGVHGGRREEYHQCAV